MGKVEKIAVLSVLFLIAVILVVSMTTDNPLQTADAAVLGEKPPAAQTAPQNPAPDQGLNLLSATVTPAGKSKVSSVLMSEGSLGLFDWT